MDKIERLYLSSTDLDTRFDTEKVKIIAEHLGKVGLEATNLLYCAVSGNKYFAWQEFADSRTITPAVTYNRFIKSAKEKDETGITFDYSYPLSEDFRSSGYIPAILTYDTEQLIPKNDQTDLDKADRWIHISNENVDSAVNSIIFLR